MLKNILQRSSHLRQDARMMNGSGPASRRGPLIEPGRTARITNLANRNDLNGQSCTIKHMIPNGSWAVEVVHMRGTDVERREVLAIPRENLEVQWKMNDHVAESSGMEELGECPICLDTNMDRRNAGFQACCGAWICKQCDVKICRMNTCPLCRADTSDNSTTATEKKLLARAKRGDASAMHNLAGRYDTGLQGFRHDQALARVWYQRAAEKGYVRAAHDLGCSHRDGEGGPVNQSLAAKYFRMAASSGHIPACTNLGIALMDGTGVVMDREEARKWLKKGVEAGDELAMRRLSILENGRPDSIFFGGGGSTHTFRFSDD